MPDAVAKPAMDEVVLDSQRYTGDPPTAFPERAAGVLPEQSVWLAAIVLAKLHKFLPEQGPVVQSCCLPKTAEEPLVVIVPVVKKLPVPVMLTLPTAAV